MKTQQLLFLILTLSVFLLALAVHALPSYPLCDCTDRTGDTPRTAGFDLCLVCQLQAGVIVSVIVPVLPEGNLVGLQYTYSSFPKTHVVVIPHPPTLI